MPHLSKFINKLESDNCKENILIKKLRAAIINIDIQNVKVLEIDAYVICLSFLLILSFSKIKLTPID